MSKIDAPLLEFINNSKSKVAIIKGSWGSGKTYFWNNFIKNNIGNFSMNYVSYVSLFGLNNIEGITEQIYLNSKNTCPETKKLSFLSWVHRQIKNTKILNAADTPYVNIALIRNLIVENGIKEFLICFDDLERIGDELKLNAILGYINRLKEERACKIVIICNEDELQDKESIMNKYREKVVDLDLTYKPTIRENLEIIWGNSIPDIIETLFLKLDVNNIRIMHQTKVAVDFFETHSKQQQLTKKRWNAFMQHVAALTIFRHAFPNIISIEDFSLATLAHYYTPDDDKNKDAEKIKLFSKVDYFYKNEDSLIIDYLTNGWVSEEEIEEAFADLNEQERNEILSNELQEIGWKVYCLFGVDTNIALEEAEKFLKKNYNKIQFSEVIWLNELLKKHKRCNYDNLVDNLIDSMIPALEKKSK